MCLLPFSVKTLLFGIADLREDEEFHLNYPGACTIATKQVGRQPAIFFFPQSLKHFVFVAIQYII